MGSRIRICSQSGIDFDTWVARFRSKLTDYSRAYVRKVVEVGSRPEHRLSYVYVGGWRSARTQVRNIYNNWAREYKQGGVEEAYEWAKDTYGKKRAPRLHEKWLCIKTGKKDRYGKYWNIEKYYHDFMRRNAHRARHDNGRAFDITPATLAVHRVLRIAMKEGSPKLFTPYGVGVKPENIYKKVKVKGKRRKIFDPSKGAHFHIQLSPPHRYITFTDDEAMLIHG